MTDDVDKDVDMLQRSVGGVLAQLREMAAELDQQAAVEYPRFLGRLSFLLIAATKLVDELHENKAAHFALLPTLQERPPEPTPPPPQQQQQQQAAQPGAQQPAYKPRTPTDAARMISAMSSLALPKVEAEDMRMLAQFVDSTPDGKGLYPVATLQMHNSAVHAALAALKEAPVGERLPAPHRQRTQCLLSEGNNKAVYDYVSFVLGNGDSQRQQQQQQRMAQRRP